MPRARDAGEPVRFEFAFSGNRERGTGNGEGADGRSVASAPIPLLSEGTLPAWGGGRSSAIAFEEAEGGGGLEGGEGLVASAPIPLLSEGTSPAWGGGRSVADVADPLENAVPGSLSSVPSPSAVPGSPFPVPGGSPPPAPSAYRSEFDAIARAMASEGKTNAVIATVGLGVAVRTLYRWIEPEGAAFVPSLAQALRVGRAEAVARVEAALFEMAVGGTRRSVNRKGEEVETEIPPNITAVQFFLKGRARAEWGGAEEAPVPAVPVAAAWDLSRLTVAEREAWLSLKRRASGAPLSPDDGED